MQETMGKNKFEVLILKQKKNKKKTQKPIKKTEG